LLGLALVLIGSAGPQWGRDTAAPPALGRDIWIALDLSRSMLAEDPISRLDRSKRYLRAMADAVERQGDYRLGLIGFAGKAKVLCPLTEDFDHFRFSLDSATPERLGSAGRMGYNDDGSNFGTSLRAALALAANLHDERARGFEHLVVVSDGDDLAGSWNRGIERLANAGIIVHVLAVGDREKDQWIPTGKADEPYLLFESNRVTTRRHDEVLQGLAGAAGGDYLAEESVREPLVRWFEESVVPLPLREWTEDRQPLLQARYGWCFAAALALFLIGFIGSDRPLNGEERP
jgi:Ca-activated chloride channel family protein